MTTGENIPLTGSPRATTTGATEGSDTDRYHNTQITAGTQNGNPTETHTGTSKQKRTDT